MPERFAVDGIWSAGAHEAAVIELAADRVRPVLDVSGDGLPRLRATLIPGLVDHHVHLGLVDRARLAGGPLVEVHDLGWELRPALAWRTAPPRGVSVRIAGPFHTAVGGYPSGRAWAPDAAVRAVVDVADARAAVAEAARAGVDFIKIALNSDMPLLSDELLRTLVRSAHQAGLPAIVHAEGVGQAARAIEAGADTLVHTPWSEVLDEKLLRRALNTVWISTLAIHDGRERDVAIENLRAFRRLGGRIRYGTDMGNGPNPVGPSSEELRLLSAAGLGVDELIGAMTGPLGTDGLRVDRVLICERPLPHTGQELIDWLAACRRLDADQLERWR